MDQTVRMRVFAASTSHIVRFVMRWLILGSVLALSLPRSGGGNCFRWYLKCVLLSIVVCYVPI